MIWGQQGAHPQQEQNKHSQDKTRMLAILRKSLD
jgi:hypothetical protein